MFKYLYIAFKTRLGFLKVSLCIYLVFVFFWCYLAFQGLIWRILLMTT